MTVSQQRGSGDQDVLTTEEAAAYLGVSRQTIYNMVCRGELEPLAPEGEWLKKPPVLYYKRDELESVRQRRLETRPSRLVRYMTPGRRASIARRQAARPAGSVA